MGSVRPGRGHERRRLPRSRFERSHKSAICWEPAGSGGSFGTRGHGAKLTVNTNNQSARPIERLAPAKSRGRRSARRRAAGGGWAGAGIGPGDVGPRAGGGLAGGGWGFAGTWTQGKGEAGAGECVPDPGKGGARVRARCRSTEVTMIRSIRCTVAS